MAIVASMWDEAVRCVATASVKGRSPAGRCKCPCIGEAPRLPRAGLAGQGIVWDLGKPPVGATDSTLDHCSSSIGLRPSGLL